MDNYFGELEDDKLETKVLIPTDDNIAYAAELLNLGEVVGIPTETVYGLAANAYDENAVEKIFIAKGRPQDNPLIVHINSLAMLDDLAVNIPEAARKLAARFWPGPLTMILKKSDKVPLAVTAGLSTVAVRFPSNQVAQALIAACEMPLAAPSANLSGSPSPTTANHVFSDLNGRIPAILDGGACTVGLESTVVLVGADKLVLLRPGSITLEQLMEIVPKIEVANGVLNEVDVDKKVASPGLKHRHYSPKAEVYIIESDFDKFKSFIESKASHNESIGALVFNDEQDLLNVPTIAFGDKNDSLAQARLLFSSLRAIDDLNVDTIYARMPDKDGIGLAIYNRLIRAAGFKIITL